ncbi:Ig-like domain repeat protein [Nocardioides daejeonensis]|uniref:Ig-like domain repeat protein n=1 Tax=Nocardioides daejeonensis TaxID=1046556 RepID=UPI000D748966|nr:Ig-like domain repeat protein [Nocardioides daejeonensis]
MRRLLAPVASLALAAGVLVVTATPASATVTSPGNGSTIRGTVTLSSSGASGGTACITGSGHRTILSMLNSANQTVVSQTKESSGSFSYDINTHNYPNGAYTVRSEERNRTGAVFCGTSTSTYNNAVTIDNYVDVVYTGALTAPQNTSVAVSASLADPTLSGGLANQPIVFSLSGGTSVTANTNAQGVATANLPISGPPRSATVSAAFVTTAYYRGDSASAPFTVTKNASKVTLAAPAAVVHGQTTSFTATVQATNGTSTPTGTVQFTVDGADFGAPVPVGSGTVTSAPTSSLSTGNHTVGAVYSGDANINGSSAATVTQTVGKAATATTLTKDQAGTVSGQAVTFTAEVDVLAPGVGTPAGGVQFTVDGQPRGTAVPLSGDSASITISNLAPGNHDVEATYNGNADFAASTSATVTHGVNKADSALELTSSVANPVSGQAVNFTAEVEAVGPGAGTPTGEVQFFVDGDPLGAPVALSNGSATSPDAHLDAGSHVVSANYAGDASFGGASDNLTQNVAAAQTKTTVTASPSPSVVGQQVTLRAEVEPVAPASGDPVGAVQFFIDGQSQGTIVELENGVAEYVTSTLAKGSHTVKARYLSGTANFVTSTSPEITHQVNKASTTTTVESSAQVSVFGQSVTLSATVDVTAPGAGAPSGTLTFKDGSTVLGTVNVDSASNFRGSITVDDLSVGQHVINVVYSGDDDFNGSDGVLVQKVQRAQTSVVVTSSLNPAPSGSPVSFTAAVAPVAPGAGTPGGTVRFTINGANLGAPVTVVDGQATSIEFSTLSPGTYQVEASYSGDANFVASSGVLDQGTGQQVAKADTEIEVSTSPGTSAHGEAVTVTTTVKAKAPATGRPTGAVQIWEGNRLLGATSLVAGAPKTGVATFVTTNLTPGTHTLRATYVGNFNFLGNVAETTHTVGLAATVTGIESSRNPATYGDAVTFTAVVGSVLPGAGTPTGSVTFKRGNQVLGTAALEDDGNRRVARFEATGLGGGTHQVTAVYSGDSAYASSASASYAQVVERAASHLDAEIFIKQLGDNGGRVRATLTGANGEPLAGRTLTFTTTQSTDHSTIQICDAVTNAQGYAWCDATTLVPAIILDGGYDVRYAGSDDHLPSSDRGTYFVGGPVSNP